ncbi:Dot/Icm secretion system substrate [Legionella lansingensis]|uniref:Dot/Icm secretion system substrate n=1 Tax=Legionella lansingensis TaxID=45067 RepID=A0A0W0VEI7_9GAMM|nr:hypothetical protein [Legionella lansingensis]KTD18548.1 Dot/Icm secretion system substrate [Legionella lansingensis]SNV51258.1 Dot/Icm secretion system substrate [Legionella lansingensis]
MLSSQKIETILIEDRADKRIREAISVSPVFENCFFHCIALHYLCNNIRLPEDLFRPAKNDSKLVLQLKELLKDEAALHEFFIDYERSKTSTSSSKRELADSEEFDSTQYLFEKTLILGILFRHWFVNQLDNKHSLAVRYEFPHLESRGCDERHITFSKLIVKFREAALEDAQAPLVDLKRNLGEMNDHLSALNSLVAHDEELTRLVGELKQLIGKQSIALAEHIPQIKISDAESALKIAEASLLAVKKAFQELKIKLEEKGIATSKEAPKDIQDAEKLLNINLSATRGYLVSLLEQLRDTPNPVYEANKVFFDEERWKIDDVEYFRSYWEEEGYPNYLEYLRRPGVKISYGDVDSILAKFLPYAIYGYESKAPLIAYEAPHFELALSIREGHFYLIPTEKTMAGLLAYAIQKQEYKENYDEIQSLQTGLLVHEESTTLSIQDKFILAGNSSSLLLAATFPLTDLETKDPEAPIAALVSRLRQLKLEMSPPKRVVVESSQGSLLTDSVSIPKSISRIQSSPPESNRSFKGQVSTSLELADSQTNVDAFEELSHPEMLKPEEMSEEVGELYWEIESYDLRDQERQLLNLLKKLGSKASLFTEKGKTQEHYKAAAIAAGTLHVQLLKHFANLLGNTEDYGTFRKNCLKAIQDNRGELENHREEGGLLMQILGNIALAIVGLGVFYGVGLLAHRYFYGRFFPFAPETAQQVSEIEMLLPQLEVKG